MFIRKPTDSDVSVVLFVVGVVVVLVGCFIDAVSTPPNRYTDAESSSNTKPTGATSSNFSFAAAWNSLRNSSLYAFGFVFENNFFFEI